ncbi:MAG: competence/damage-inducible protein A, partial [Bryobacteraceae bacterium]
MDAEIVAVGSEMLTASRIDTNSLYLTGELNGLGIEVIRKTIVGDDLRRLAGIVSAALNEVRIVILTGGLGPTEDDVTREAVAAALERSLIFHQGVCDGITDRFRRFGRRMAENNKRQAYIIEGAEVLPNSRGTAPGQWIVHNGAILMLLPGPPKELNAMFEEQCLPRLRKLVPEQVIRTRFFRVTGMGESDVDQLIAPVYTRYSNPACTILAAAGDIQIHLRARCVTGEEAENLLMLVGGEIEQVLGDRLYTRNGALLEECVSGLLLEMGETVSLAESCTGGMLAERFTSTPGSSNNFHGGMVTYTDEMKIRLLGVHPEMLRIEGAVSEPVARVMASAIRRLLGTTYGLSVTGFAGPNGGTENNPVGTVYI